MRCRPRNLSTATAVVLAGALGVAGVSAAQDGSGPRPVAPTAGKALARGVAFTFKASAPAGSKVFLKVSKSKKVGADGTLRTDVYFRSMANRSGSSFTKKTDRYPALPDYFLNRRGTYYWQAYLIQCPLDGGNDCNVEGPVRSFRIR